MFKPARLIPNSINFSADDYLDWATIDSQSNLSPEFPPPFPEYSHQLDFRSRGKQRIKVSVPQGKIVRINQNHFFPGTFEIGEQLLFTGFGNPGALSLEFSRPLYGVGVNIQSDPQVPSGTPAPFPFTAIVKVRDRQNQSLGEFNLPGLSKIEAGSGTTFIGLAQEQGQIAKVAIEVIENGVSIPFAINTLQLKTYSLVPAQGFTSIREYVAHFG
ncbi:MAG: hypothetical protein AAFR89_08420 [Cyanobacteria bacterium J06633_1]